MTLDEFMARIEGPRKRTATGWVVRCPAHPDRDPSLSVTPISDRILVKCHAGCDAEAVVEALGLTLADLFTESRERDERPAQAQPKRLAATYEYRDEHGRALYRKLRFEPKTFGWERFEVDRWVAGLGDVRRVPYRLPALAAAERDSVAWIVEGEKDADNLTAAGAECVTSSKDWQDAWSPLFAGLHVVIIQDNDGPGRKIAAQVQRSLGSLPASVLVMAMPGAVEGGDVSDWLRGGGTYQALLRIARSRPDTFVSSSERARDERESRLATGPRVLSFGVPYLDHALTGILPEDVVLVSAATGAGKTEIAATIGLSVAGIGKRVHMFALEAGHMEIERRIKYRLLAARYYAEDRYARKTIRYQDWAAGLLDEETQRYEYETRERVRDMTRNLHTYYKAGDFTGDDFTRVAAKIAEETDLIILDHLHYLDTEEASENAGYKRITKQIRTAALTYGKPVIVVAHIRKSDRFAQRLVPTIEDIHGTSEISKIATKAIMLARAEDQPNRLKTVSNTYVQVVKNRTDGSVCRFVAMVGFDLRTNTYQGEYSMFRPTDGGKAMTPLSRDEIPEWAAGAVPPET